MARGSKPVADAVAKAARSARERGGAAQRERRGGRAMDVFGGEIRRRDLFPLLVLHLIHREPTYGNHLIEEIERITEGAISVNPNTVYPLLRQLESDGLIKGSWEHPDRRTRRYYAITAAGRREHKRLATELEPFLDSVIRSVSLIKRELYGD
ncbi:MAG TPA: PadR family transcriptional regulator [Solirubrobacterales bacterium]|nr:PadR family transcriptional regulator [Solirubrobacterales bacterium]